MPKKNKKFKVITSLSGAMGYNPMKALEEMQADIRGGRTRKGKLKLVKKGLGGAIAKGAKKLGMKVKTKLNERRMKKQLDKLGYDPDAVSGPNTLSKIIEREAKKNRKAEGGIARGGRAAIRGIKFTGVK